MDGTEAGERDFRQYLRTLRRRRLTVALSFVVVLAAAVAYSFSRHPVYKATATVLVPEQQPSSALNVSNSQPQNPTASQRQLADAQEFAGGDAVKATAQKELGSQTQVAIGTSTTADVLTFTATDRSRTRAAEVANTYARAFLTADRSNQVSQYTSQITALEQSISNLKSQQAKLPSNTAQYAALSESISTLTQTVEQTDAAAQLASTVGPSIIHLAPVPTSPSSPDHSLDVLLGAILGIILGVGAAFVRDRLDDGIASRQAVERASGGRPVIGLIPMVAAWRNKDSHHVALTESPHSDAAEAYRTLRTAVQFLNVDSPKKILALTSSRPGEGKSTAAANLAVSFAIAGQRVVLVSCDLRRPSVHDFFHLTNTAGLTSLLLETTRLEDTLQEPESLPNLRVLASGPIPPNPAEVLSSKKVEEIIEHLAAEADVVILDCPPVLPVTDTLLVSRIAQGVLVLASPQQTRIRELERTVELLDQVNAPIVGMVLNQVPVGSGFGYDYGYAYGYGYYESANSSHRERDTMPLRDTNDRSPEEGMDKTNNDAAGLDDPRAPWSNNRASSLQDTVAGGAPKVEPE